MQISQIISCETIVNKNGLWAYSPVRYDQSLKPCEPTPAYVVTFVYSMLLRSLIIIQSHVCKISRQPKDNLIQSEFMKGSPLNLISFNRCSQDCGDHTIWAFWIRTCVFFSWAARCKYYRNPSVKFWGDWILHSVTWMTSSWLFQAQINSCPAWPSGFNGKTTST